MHLNHLHLSPISTKFQAQKLPELLCKTALAVQALSRIRLDQ